MAIFRQKTDFSPKNTKNFKFKKNKNDADLPPVRMMYYTSKFGIRNVALLDGENSVFSVFLVQKERKVEKRSNRGPPPYAFC